MTEAIDLEALAQTFPALVVQPINEVELLAQVRQLTSIAGDSPQRKMAQIRLSDLLAYLSLFYHNQQELVDDSTYDQIQDLYEQHFGEYLIVGAPVLGEGVSLEYYLGSLKKLKKEDAIERWQRQHAGPYVLEDKVDGITLLYVSTQVNGQRVHKLYTRGQGKIGEDVSHIYPYLNIPQLDFNVAIRGEAVFTKEAFGRVGVDLKSARSGVSGAINAKDSFNPTIVQEIKFIAYQIMGSLETPETQILQLADLGFMVPWATIAETIDMAMLKQLYEERLIDAPYEMDGLVIYQNIGAKYPSDKPPEHVIAFKVNLKAVETTVTEVRWQTSREGRLKPVVHYEPVEWIEDLDETGAKASATLTKATGHNARNIIQNKIGPGARILVTRSGKAIPYIVSVIQQAADYSFPDPNVYGNYEWNENEVEFIVVSSNLEMLAAQIEFFFEKLDIKNIGPARTRAMIDLGLNTLSAILNATPQDFAQMERVGPDLANKMYTEIHARITQAPLEKVMAASGIFPNVGERRFKAILDVYPTLMESARCDVDEIATAIHEIKGFNKLADEIAANLSAFADWLDQHPAITVRQPGVIVAPGRVVTSGQNVSVPQSCSTTGLVPSSGTLLTIVPGQPMIPATLQGKTFVFSTFAGDLGRQLTTEVEARGGRIGSSVSKNTTALIMKNLDESTGKSQKADQYKIPKLSVEEFRRQYLS